MKFLITLEKGRAPTQAQKGLIRAEMARIGYDPITANDYVDWLTDRLIRPDPAPVARPNSKRPHGAKSDT